MTPIITALMGTSFLAWIFRKQRSIPEYFDLDRFLKSEKHRDTKQRK